MTAAHVVVAGVPWSGSQTLVDALATVAPSLVTTIGLPDMDVGRPDTTSTPAVVGLLVLDPASIAGDDECALVEALAATTGHLALVITKVDAFWDWPTIARASRAVLDPTGQLPVFAVSAAAALAGAVDESGVDALAVWIGDRLADGPASPVVLTGPPARSEPADEMVDRRARALRRRDRGRPDRLAALRSGLAAIRSDASTALSTGLRDINDAARDSVARLTRSRVQAHENWLVDAVNELRATVDADVRRQLERLRATVLLGIEPPEISPPVAASGALALRTPPLRRHSVEDVALLVVGASAGFSVGRFVVWPLAEVEALRWLSVPAGLIVGLVLAGSVMAVRRATTLRNQVRGWTAEALSEARVAVEQEVAATLVAAEPAISGRVVRHYERRSRILGDEVAEIDAALRRRRGGTGQMSSASNSGHPWAPMDRSDPTPMERT